MALLLVLVLYGVVCLTYWRIDDVSQVVGRWHNCYEAEYATQRAPDGAIQRQVVTKGQKSFAKSKTVRH